MRLVKHCARTASGGWTTEFATGHPPIPDDIATLRADVLGSHAEPGAPLCWWPHRDGWGAVTALHRRGRHPAAMELARLLVWCEHPDRVGVHNHIAWELVPDRPPQPPLLDQTIGVAR